MNGFEFISANTAHEKTGGTEMDNMAICDLHIHSTCSDGTYSPCELIDLAIQKGISAIALCDHNTTKGLDGFVEYAVGKNIEAVPGIEISADHNGKEVHILGLFLGTEAREKIDVFLRTVNENKEKNNHELAYRLCDHGYDITYEEVKKDSSGARVNRVHFARLLMKKGYVESISQAFDTVLSEKYGIYQPPEKIDAVDVIPFLVSVGALTVMAHPLLNLTIQELEEFLPLAKENGLVAVETRYSTYNDSDRRTADELAEKFGLLRSGGSDFHGTNKPHIDIGTGCGDLRVPLEFYELLKERLLCKM